MAKHLKDIREREGWFNTPAIAGTCLVLILCVVLLAVYQTRPSSGPEAGAPSGSLTMTPVSGPSVTGSPHEPNPIHSSGPSSGIAILPSPTPPVRVLKAPFIPCAASLPSNYVCYKIRPGDTLSGITDAFGNAHLSTVYSWNVTAIGRDPNLIHPGVVLVVQVL